MNTPIQNANASNYGKLALALCLGGTVLAVLIGLVARALGYDARMWAYLLFAAFQVAAIVIGWRFRREHLGRASAITASILLVLSFGLLA
jgi:membrane protein implicated in regulation of membrane protease activity